MFFQTTFISFRKMLRFNLRKKFLLSYLGIISIVVIALVSVTLATSNQVIKGRTRELTLQIVNQISQNIEYKVKDIEYITYIISMDTRINDFIKSEKDDLGKNSSLVYSEASKAIQELALKYKFINFVSIKTKNNKPLLISNKGKAISINFINEIFYNHQFRVRESENKPVWINSYDSSQVFLMQNLGNEEGMILIGIDASYLRSLGSEYSIVKEENIVVIDEKNNNLVYGILTATQVTKLANSNILYTDLNNFDINYQNTKYMITMAVTPNLKWRVLCIIPSAELVKGYDVMKSLILIVCIISVLISILLAYIMAFNITRNISNLENTMRKVEDGDLNIRVKPKSYDEVGMLGLRFNYMINKINTLIDTISAERLAKQQAEFQVIQAQINPHFLYNTLGSIKWLSRMKQQDEIEGMVTSLIELLRKSIRRKSEFQTLGEEIDYIKNYLALQKIRYENRFVDIYQTDPQLFNCEMLNFILQPLVENALYHGLELSRGNGKIVIRALKDKEMLVLEVEDNGIGMSQEIINKILTTEKMTYPGLSSLGVKIVNDRVKLHYGNEYGLTYSSIEGIGTKATVILPYSINTSEDQII